jgi:hypothetical protein
MFVVQATGSIIRLTEIEGHNAWLNQLWLCQTERLNHLSRIFVYRSNVSLSDGFGPKVVEPRLSGLTLSKNKKYIFYSSVN